METATMRSSHNSSFVFGLKLILYFILAAAATTWLIGRASAQEVYFNQGGQIDTQILKSLDEAAALAAADRSQPVTVDVLIFQFTHNEIADKILDVVEANPNLTVRMVSDWTSMNSQDGYTKRNVPKWPGVDGRNHRQNSYFSPSQNRPPYLAEVAQGRYRDACEGTVDVSGRVPRFTPVEPAKPDAPTDPGANATPAERDAYEAALQAYQEDLETYDELLEKYQSDAAIKQEYKQKMEECIAALERRFGGNTLPNLKPRFKIDEPYVWSSSRRRVVYNHAASEGLNHHKGLVIRAGGRPQMVLSGSYNWSPTAEDSNYENLMRIDRDDYWDRDILYDYAAEFDGFFFDTEVTLTLDEAHEFGGWLRRKIAFDAGAGSDPGPRPDRSNPAGANTPGTVSGSGCDPAVNPNCTLTGDILAAARMLEPVNLNNASESMMTDRLGITGDEATRIRRERRVNGPFADLADFENRTGLALSPDAVETGTSKISVNEADADQLQALPGIGPVLAQRIVDYREQNGELDTLEELENVSGIGPVTLERLRPWASTDYSKVFFSSRRLGEQAGTGYAPSNAEKTILVKKAGGDGAERVPGVLTQPVIDLVRRSKEGDTVRIAAYGLSRSTQEFDEIVDAARRGVKFQIVLNKQYVASTISAFKDVVDNEDLDIEVRIPRKVMHEKFGFNGDDVFNGSANLSNSSSTKHSEDRFWFKNKPELVNEFQGRFDQLWEAGRVRVEPSHGAG